ncbi:MAG TPA: sulfotransferase [Rhizomicrobium sp.]|nr:sulfotransferase [Rhizomicrobium sp.]
MADAAATRPCKTGESARDCFAVARERLFPPLQNRALAQAADALAEGQTALAESLVSRFLEKKPRDAHALNLMADIARRANRFENAEQLLSRCVALSPETQGFRYNYAVVLRRLHKYEEANAQLDRLLGRDPANALFRGQKAELLSAMGRHSEVLVYRRALAEEFPRDTDILVRYANALSGAGLHTECIAVYRKALEIEPSLEGVYSALASLKVYRFTPADIDAMEKQLKSPARSAQDRAALRHALGKAYGDMKRYDKSFENYAKSNALKRIQADFDIERVTAHRKGFEAFFTENFFRERTGWGCHSNAPIFIVGLPRSGSTLLEQILCSHSAIEGLGELHALDTVLVRPLVRFRKEVQLEQFANGAVVDKNGLLNAYKQIFDRLKGDEFRSMGEFYLQSMRRRQLTERLFFTDKTLVNYACIGLIHLILPNSKIIDARRHPLDCGWSCFKSQFPGNHFSLRLNDIGQDYVNYARLMAHFDRVLPGKVHRVIYEELIADPDAQIRRVFDYLELPFEEQCLRFYENQRPVRTQSSGQVRMPLYRSGVAQWVPYEPWLGPLKSALGPILDCYPNVPE